MVHQQCLAQETKQRLLARAWTCCGGVGSPGLCTVRWKAAGCGESGFLSAAPASKHRESYGSETYTFSALLASRQVLNLIAATLEIITTFQAVLQGNL